MKFHVPYFCVLMPTIFLLSSSTIERVPSAVSDEKIAATLFRRIRSEYPHVQEPPDLDSAARERICRPIFHSNYMQVVRTGLVENFDEMYEFLKRKKPDLFVPTQGTSADSSRLGFLRQSGVRLLRQVSSAVGMSNHDELYTQPTELIEVYTSQDTQETVSEYVFPCLYIVNRGYENTMYFGYVSAGEYNLSDTSDSYVVGRFIFSYFHHMNNNDEIDVFAVVEEPAQVTPTWDVERTYKNDRAKHELDDRVCKLTRMERLRACTLILSSAYFEELEFVPKYEYVDRVKCFKKTIFFQNHRVKAELNGKLHEEWMVRCRVQVNSTEAASNPSEYFFSRAYESPDKAFVFVSTGDEDSPVVLEYIFSKVRFATRST